MTACVAPITVAALMGVLETIAKFVGSPAARQRQVGDAVARCYAATVQNSRRLHQLAERAPNTASAAGLSELAASEEAVSARLLEALKAAARSAPAIEEAPESATAPSHWGRLVQALEAQRRLVQTLREHTAEFAESFAATAQLFDELRAVESMHCERLRALIARADPQAMN